MAARLALDEGHEVVAHARNDRRAEETRSKLPGAQEVLVGDLSSIAETKSLGEQVNGLGTFDAVIHNAAVGDQEPKRMETEDGLPHLFAIDTLAPYILTALIRR